MYPARGGGKTPKKASPSPTSFRLAGSLRLAGLLLFFLAVAPAVRAGDFLVTTAASTGPGFLRQAILDANAQASAGPHTIRFAPEVTRAGTILLAAALPPVQANLTIAGPAQPLILEATGPFRQPVGMYLYIDERQLFTTALITNKTTGYVLVEPGERSLKIDTTRTGPNALFPAATVLNPVLALAPDGYYSVFVTGTMQAPEAVVLEDNLARPAAGKAYVRVVHLSPDAPAVDLAGTLAGNGGTPPVLIGNRAYKQVTDFTPVDAGFYRLQVRPAGSETALPTFTQTNQVVSTFVPAGTALTEFTMNFEPGKIYTLAVRGFVNTADKGETVHPLSVGATINLYW
jgi:hypothetical protein